VIYHLANENDWLVANFCDEPYMGGTQDIIDGYIHLSTREQIMESAARHRTGEHGLLMLAVEKMEIFGALRWEVSRKGALFPHCYGPLPFAAVVWTAPLSVGPDNRHIFPRMSE